MKRKAITFILALALFVSLTVPALASNAFPVIAESYELNISNIISVGECTIFHIIDDEKNVYGGLPMIFANAPARVTSAKGIESPYQIIKIEMSEKDSIMLADLPVGDNNLIEPIIGSWTRDGGAGFYSAGFEFILEKGIYYFRYFNGPMTDDNFIVVVEGDNTSIPQTPDSADIKVLVNGTAVSFDQPPIIQNGRTLVPLRAIFEALGATVDYEQSTQTLTAVRENVTVIMQIGNSVFTVNGEQKTLDVAPQIIGGRTLVPARAIAESFGAEVAWDQSTQTMTITMG